MEAQPDIAARLAAAGLPVPPGFCVTTAAYRRLRETGPRGDLCIRTLAMPADTNANGDIFGGWLLSQMDLGGAIYARNLSRSRALLVGSGGA